MLGWLLKPLALASTLALSTLGVLGQKYQRARFAFHLTLYVSTLGVVSVWGVVVSLLATLAGQRLNINYLVARSFYYVCSPLIGMPMIVEGEEHLSGLAKARGGRGQSAILVGNHQSFLDILYLGRIFPKRASIMAKQELKWSPLLGQYLTLSGAVMVNRRDRQGAMRALEKAGEEMKQSGVSLWVFPEGTRSSKAEPVLLPFKKGAFHLAVQAQVPIIPVVCENYHRLFDGRTRMERGSLRIKVLPPISTEGLTTDDVTALTESTREIMLATLKEISAPGPGLVDSASHDDMDLLAASSLLSAVPSAEQVNKAIRRRAGGEAESSRAAQEAADEAGMMQTSSSVDPKGGETTEDEMDEDAVLLKRPKAT